MVLLVSRVSIVRIQREIRGAGQEEAFKNATKDEVVIKLDQKEGFLGSARGGGHGSEQRHRGTSCRAWLGALESEWQEMRGRVGWSLP